MGLPVEEILSEAYPQRDNVYFALMEQRIAAPEKWSAENPALYTLVLTLRNDDGQVAESRSCKVGFRDVRLRGREMLVNGVPVNDMEWGGVYWSNWAGLSDVTRSMQTQRGLGASKIRRPRSAVRSTS